MLDEIGLASWRRVVTSSAAAMLDEELLVFAPKPKRYLRLNASSAALWHAIRHSIDRRGTVETYATRLGVPSEAAEALMACLLYTSRCV